MKPRSLREMIRAKEAIERGEVKPANVWEVKPNGKGALVRRALDTERFRQAQATVWDERVASARRKLRLSQPEFARLLGISVRTLHHWEQGTRRPSGAARVLLRIAARHPEAVLEAA
jgi:DNA-binding transcriptional regulator YiaG